MFVFRHSKLVGGSNNSLIPLLLLPSLSCPLHIPVLLALFVFRLKKARSRPPDTHTDKETTTAEEDDEETQFLEGTQALEEVQVRAELALWGVRRFERTLLTLADHAAAEMGQSAVQGAAGGMSAGAGGGAGGGGILLGDGGRLSEGGAAGAWVSRKADAVTVYRAARGGPGGLVSVGSGGNCRGSEEGSLTYELMRTEGCNRKVHDSCSSAYHEGQAALPVQRMRQQPLREHLPLRVPERLMWIEGYRSQPG